MKRALVISGGGQRGSFAVGAASYLIEALGLDFDIFAGTSTGSLISPLLAANGAGALPQLRREYTTVTTSDIITDRWKHPDSWFPVSSLYLTTPLRKRVEKGLASDVLDRIAARGKQLFVTTVDMVSGHIVYFHTGQAPANGNGDFVELRGRSQLVDAMVASASIPFFMPPVEMPLPASPHAAVVDGGVRQYAPIEVAIAAGADEIWCLVLMPPPKIRPAHTGDFKSIVTVAETTVDMLSQEVADGDIKLSRLYTDSLDYLDGVRDRLRKAIPGSAEEIDRAFDADDNPFRGKKAVKLNIIRPEKMLAGDTLKFVPAEMMENMLYGCQRAQELFPRPDLATGWCDRLKAKPVAVVGEDQRQLQPQ